LHCGGTGDEWLAGRSFAPGAGDRRAALLVVVDGLGRPALARSSDETNGSDAPESRLPVKA
jgi:hypothetical protein